MSKNRKNIIIGMVLFMVVFIIFVIFYESNNIVAESQTYYLYDRMQDKFDFVNYEILEIVENKEEFDKFINKYGLYSYDDKDFRYNYIFVAIKSDSCLESVSFKKIKKNNNRYSLVFDDRRFCGGPCADRITIFEVQIDKSINDISLFDVVIDYDETDLEDCEYLTRVDKPVLYLYPEEDMNVSVTFENKNTLLSTYPKYEEKWEIFAKKDGTLIDKRGREYYALYWDEKINHEEKFETGFYVKSEDSIEFLEEKLFEMGFTDREANEFIMYWLLIMEQGGDNLVHFHFTEERQEQNRIIIEPKIDSLFRVSIEIMKVNNEIFIEEQKIERFERVGFSALEWGGSIIE